MTRLQMYLKNNDEKTEPEYDQSTDVAKLRCNIGELESLDQYQIEDLYSDFSSSSYCASWMNLTTNILNEFRKWLKGKPGDCVEYYKPSWYKPKLTKASNGNSK